MPFPEPDVVKTLLLRFHPGTDMKDFETHRKQALQLIARTVKVYLEPWQREALTSLLTDIVSGRVHGNGIRFEESHLLHALNEGQLQVAIAQFLTYVYVQRRVDTKMWEKRGAEQDHFRHRLQST